MSTYNYKPGLGNAASFQVSGIPYVTGGIDATSATGLSFPLTTRWIVVSNVDGSATLRVGFSENGVDGTNYFEVDQNQISPRVEVKATQIWLSGSSNCSVVAGLTGIETVNIDNISVSPSGSNWSGSLNALVG
jgi:hypothetical protein